MSDKLFIHSPESERQADDFAKLARQQFQKGQFSERQRIARWLTQCSSLGKVTGKVAIGLLDSWHPNGFFLGIRKLAKNIKSCEQDVRTAIKSLETEKLIRIEHGKMGMANRYWINF